MFRRALGSAARRARLSAGGCAIPRWSSGQRPAPAGGAVAAQQLLAFSVLLDLSRNRALATLRIVAPAKAGAQGSWPQPQESRIPVCAFARTACTRGQVTRAASTTPARRRRVERLSANRQCGSRARWLCARCVAVAIATKRKPREPGGALGAWGPEGGRGKPVFRVFTQGGGSESNRHCAGRAAHLTRAF